MIQLPSGSLEDVRMINIRFCIYRVTDLSIRLKVALKTELHRVLELELEQTNNDSTIF